MMWTRFISLVVGWLVGWLVGTASCPTPASHCRQEVRARFPHKPWIDVFSKADLLQSVFDEAEALRGAARSEVDDRESGAGAESRGGVKDPVDLAVRLPQALRVSSTTREGIVGLQRSIIAMFQAEQAQCAELATQGTDLGVGGSDIPVAAAIT